MGASKRQKERQRANRRAKLRVIEDNNLSKDTRFVDIRIPPRDFCNMKDLTPFYAFKYMDGRIPEEARVYL